MTSPCIVTCPPLPAEPLALATIEPVLLTVPATISIVPPLLTIDVVEIFPLLRITEAINVAAEFAAITTYPPGASTSRLFSIRDL